MISYSVYKVVHLVGIFMIMVSLGGMMFHSLAGGSPDHPARKRGAMTHGIGMFLVLLGGFGLLARLGMHGGWGGWVYAKLAIWLVMGGLIAIVRRKRDWNRALWWGVVALGGLAAYLANYKPF